MGTEDQIHPISVSKARNRLAQVKSILYRLEPIYEDYHHTSHDLVSRSSTDDPQSVARQRYELDQLELQLEGIRQELVDLDCVMKDFRTGLVDFVAIREETPVWLCFKRGEESLDYYHGWNDGFVGRKPIDFE